MMRILICIIGVSISMMMTGCGSTDPVYLRQAQTGMTATCGPYTVGPGPSWAAAAARERGCVEDYRHQGYERVSK